MTFVALSRRVIKPSVIHRRDLRVPPKAQRRGGTGCPQQQSRSGGIRESVLDGGRYRRLGQGRGRSHAQGGETEEEARAATEAEAKRRAEEEAAPRATGEKTRAEQQAEAEARARAEAEMILGLAPLDLRGRTRSRFPRSFFQNGGRTERAATR